MRIVLLLIVVGMTTGCTAFKNEHSRTVLLDRKTGETRDCTVAISRTNAAYEKYEECIRTYEQEGYVIWSQY